MSIHLYRHLKSHLVDIYQVLRPLMKILCYTIYYVINNAYFCVVKHKNNYENEIYYLMLYKRPENDGRQPTADSEQIIVHIGPF